MNNELIEVDKEQFLNFVIDGEWFGLEVPYVKEIICMQAITKIPNLPEYVRGIINVRGKIIPVVDVRIRFNKPARAYDERTCIIIIEVDGMSIGLIVDRVEEVVSVGQAQKVLTPDSYEAHTRYISGIIKQGEQIQLIIDRHKLVND